MSDFQVGDVVVCVRNTPASHWADVPGYLQAVAQLSLGGFYRVVSVDYYSAYADGPGETIRIDGPNAPAAPGWPDMPEGWDPDRFRKLPKADEQFTQSIRACKPHRHEVPA